MKLTSANKFRWGLVYIVIGIHALWQHLEILMYNEVRPSAEDTIVAFFWIVGLIWAYYVGKSSIYDYAPDLIHADELRSRVWNWGEEAFANEPDNNKFNQLLDLIDESEVVNGQNSKM